jgi:hypothetical protein
MLLVSSTSSPLLRLTDFQNAARPINFRPSLGLIEADWPVTMGGQSSKEKRITPQDRAILDLKIQRDRLLQCQKKINVVVEREMESAKTHLAAGNKQLALLALKKKKYQEGLLSSTSAQLLNLEQLVQLELLWFLTMIDYEYRICSSRTAVFTRPKERKQRFGRTPKGNVA